MTSRTSNLAAHVMNYKFSFLVLTYFSTNFKGLGYGLAVDAGHD